MRLEFEDIAENKRTYGCAQPPAGVTLGQIFDKDPNLKRVEKALLQVSVNGVRADNWREMAPVKNDHVKFTVGPGDFLSAPLFTIPGLFGITPAIAVSLSTIFGIVSVASFFIDLFNRPKSPKLSTGPRESPTYGFEGLQDTFAPGNPIPVTYGTHRQGGQVLMFYLEVASGSNGRQVIMNEQLGLCHGPVSSITAVEINRILATDISSSVSIQTRTGGTSQSVMSGFDRIRNTFADGREITSESIIYKTVGNATESFDLIIAAPALTAPNKKGNIRRQKVGYSVERRADGATAWTVVASPREITAGSLQRLYFQHSFPLPSRGAYDFRVTKLSHIDTNPPGAHDIYLHAVTEYGDITGPYSGIAQIGVRAVATSQLQGGRPNTTALVHGRLVRVYTSATAFTTEWSANPAWGVFDYMTSSVYGMKIALADMDIQSFVDFATLANSFCTNCGPALAVTPATGTVTESENVNLRITGGTGTYSFQTTTGCLTIAANGNATNGGSAAVSCPTNTRSVTGNAWEYYGHSSQASSCSGNNYYKFRRFNCANIEIDCQNAQAQQPACGAGPLTCTDGSPNCAGSPCICGNVPCQGCAAEVGTGAWCDLRTAGMINSGCAPCVLTMSGGAVVTITDQGGVSVSATISLP